jgi:hypothetical protein
MQPLHSIAVSLVPSVPAEPAIILYDQMNNPAPTPTPPAPGGVTSQDFEPELDSYDSFAADDFVVPAGQIWNITEVDVIGEYSEPPVQPDSFHVFFYADSGTLPGTLVASRLANPFSGFKYFVITLTSPVTLTEGACRVSVQAREDFASSGERFWDKPVGYIELRCSVAEPGRRLRGRVPHLGTEDYLPFNAKWARPTIPSGWDSRASWSHSTASPYPSAAPVDR